MDTLSFFRLLFPLPEVCLSSLVMWQDWPQDHNHWALSWLSDGHSKAPATSMSGEKRKEKKVRGCEKKSIGFHYPVGQCHWRVSDPATLPARSIATDKRKACWQCAGTSQNTDLHFKSVKGHHTPRGHAQGARRSMGWGGSGHWIRAFLGWGVGGRTWSGFHTLPPSSAVWLSYFSPLTLLSLHQLFTFGSTKGNPGALIVAERNSSPSQSATSSFFFPLSLSFAFSFFPPDWPSPAPNPYWRNYDNPICM